LILPTTNKYMDKIITINDIKIKSVTSTLNEEDGKVYVYVDYWLKEKDTNVNWKLKNIVFKETDLTTTEISTIKKILDVAYKKAKIIESIS